MAACDTQMQPKMTEVNTTFARGKGVTSVTVKPANHQAKAVRSGGPKSARSESSPRPQSSHPDTDLLTRFRHVYAGKGGWYGHRGAKGSGPINTGKIPNGFVSKYKREILRKLSKSLREQAGLEVKTVDGDQLKENRIHKSVRKVETNPASKKVDRANENQIDTKHIISKDSSAAGQQTNPKATSDGKQGTKDEQSLGDLQSSPGQTTDDGRSENSKAIEAVCVENTPGKHQGKQYTINTQRGSTQREETLNIPTVNASDESLTNRPLNYPHADNIERDIGSIHISSACIDTVYGDEHLQGEFKAPQTVRSCPTRIGHKGKGGNWTKTSTGTGKGAGCGDSSTNSPGKKSGRAPRCRTLPTSNKTKPKKGTRSKSVKNVGGSQEAEKIRMTLFSRLSQEAQWAISETRREMGVSPLQGDDKEPGQDSPVPSDASDPGDDGSVKDLDISPDPPEDTELTGYGDPLDSQEVVQRSDSPVHYKDYDAMPGPNPSERRSVGYSRLRKANTTQELSKRTNNKSQTSLSYSRPGHIAETQITQIPSAGMSKRRPSDRGGGSQLSSNNRMRHSYHGFPKTRLPEINSDLDEERSKITDMDRPHNRHRRIPGVGQYKIVGTHAPMRREETFEITPPGYDSRFDLPRTDLNVEDDTPEEIKQIAIAKCTEWLMKHFVS